MRQRLAVVYKDGEGECMVRVILGPLAINIGLFNKPRRLRRESRKLDENA